MRSISSRRLAPESAGSEGVSGMTQVMEVDGRQAGPGDGGQPGAAAEVAMPQRRAHRAGEHERLVVAGVQALEMLGQLSPNDVREWYGAPCCPGLGRPERRSAAAAFPRSGGRSLCARVRVVAVVP